ncbi:His Kinase A (phospho-acceptor) domain-containing protein [Vibrio xiamenensis]|uniref:histidine kinase n=1 Tax=Vibrio xiamenensis TaxID=861298 RepID=A0A1G8ANZ3_9VIBR|nr:ATP-binding protein [Vibrio xiamenensis]SDH22619.1 His Kinase A (phospho-acceptor) domain-containing protein [Vibrio xiamenensis]
MKSKLLLSDLLNQMSFALCIVKRDYSIVMANQYFLSRVKGISNNIVGENLLKLFPDSAKFLKRKVDTAFMIESPSFSSWEQSPHVLPFKTSRPVSGREERMYQDLELIPIHSENGVLEHLCLCVYDSTITASQQKELTDVTNRLRQEHQALKQAQTQLLQSEKMASIGQLSAGIAHEINNPIGFITSNMQTLDDYFKKMTGFIESVNALMAEEEASAVRSNIAELYANAQLDFIIEDIADLISESLEGSSRVMAIVKNLKEFSHVDSADWACVDITEGIDSTLRIINNEIKYHIEVERHYAANTPNIYCQPMQLNQVFLNILVNASQAIKEQGVIRVDVAPLNDDKVEIKISDTGSGIDKKHLASIFEPFFTTKPVGSGTGLGLSVSYGIVHAHNGSIEVESELNVGTTFTITLPVAGASQAEHTKETE